ncbi:DoxX family membrane protein [Frankia sp. CNm7]|uniref:DoxX family membrane protein n=2 Tax=Frankia nepalensis TaxID=1836974 RepID=A0A937RQD6_9ACTN|nr:DoxX family membrane protein [Frankia nepalensis]MBL7513954.1 DoxX family membrane protein [Frankia nepalensis]MBL7517907.1 DoxX family membrane protein [Frankia nepalensis]MBL7633070.1 DoxX family membrane protein [Frankia nepalensis]
MQPATAGPSRPGATRPPLGARAWVRVVSTLLRLGLGVVWLVAGALKIGDPDGMVRTVRAFRILPEALVEPVAYAVPFVEIVLGALLVLGLAVRVCALLSALMLAAYIAAIASAAARGLRIECGCFSSGGELAADAPTHYTSELVRDSLLLVASGLLVRWPAGFLALDRLLDGPSPSRRRARAPEDWDDADGNWDEADGNWDDTYDDTFVDADRRTGPASGPRRGDGRDE